MDLGASAFGVYSKAWSVNRYGVVAGNSSVGLDTSHIRPIGWTGGEAFDLKPAVNEMDSRARDINDAGTVVGHINSDTPRLLALVWPHYQDAPIDLNTRLDARGCHDADDNRARLTQGVAINNRGEILAKGLFGFSQFEWFRLVPVSNH